MALDRNKSALTHQITQASFQWLDNHGFKPVETEVWMPPRKDEKSWIADLAAVIHPTQTELINLKMLPRPPRWCPMSKRTPEWEAHYSEQRAVWDERYLSLCRRMTALVEVKASKSDYRGDRKWTAEIPTDMAFVAMPAGMIPKELWPDGWGVLELRGDVMCKVRNPVVRRATVEEHLHVVYQIAERRDHHTRYARIREWQKQERSEQAEYVTAERISKIVSAVLDICRGETRYGKIESVEQALALHGLRNVHERQLEQLAQAFGILAKRPESGQNRISRSVPILSDMDSEGSTA